MGISHSAVSDKENGSIGIKPPERRKFADVFGLTLAQFDELWRAQRVHERPPPGRIPVINRGPAGQVMPYDHSQYSDGEYHNAMEYIERGTQADPLAYALIIVGDSMEPTFYEGDCVVFVPVYRVPRPTVKLTQGSVVCIRVSAENPTGEGVSVGRLPRPRRPRGPPHENPHHQGQPQAPAHRR